jgi:hypothetical protein
MEGAHQAKLQSRKNLEAREANRGIILGCNCVDISMWKPKYYSNFRVVLTMPTYIKMTSNQ